MAGRRPAEAVEHFIAPIRDAVACVIRQPALTSGNPRPGVVQALVLNEGEPVRMGRSRLRLALNQKFMIVDAEGERGRYKVSTTSYAYAIFDKDGEIISFHYHPESGIDFCHMHLRRVPEFKKVHFPTGRVAIEEVIALTIRDLGVQPRRADYREVISGALERFRAWRTWHSRGTM